MIRKLDRVSGNVQHLQHLLRGDHCYEWTPQEDKLLETNEGLLVRWKGNEAVDLRKRYLRWEQKGQES